VKKGNFWKRAAYYDQPTFNRSSKESPIVHKGVILPKCWAKGFMYMLSWGCRTDLESADFNRLANWLCCCYLCVSCITSGCLLSVSLSLYVK